MTQHTYDNESVQELLNWAKKMLETKNYPTEKYELNKCTTIINGKTYLESLVAMIGRNWENPTFHPTIDQLWEFREKWEGKEENKNRSIIATVIIKKENFYKFSFFCFVHPQGFEPWTH